MKKFLILFLAAALLLCAGGCDAAVPDPDAGQRPSASGPTPSGAPSEEPPDITCVAPVYWHMKIVQVDESSVLVVNAEDGEGPGLSSMTVRDKAIYRVGEQGTLPFDALRPGMLVEVLGGPVAESYPAQFEASAVGILDDGDDLVGLYRAVIQELWEVDPGLNGGIVRLGLDFARAGLSTQEQAALEYLTGQELGLDYITGTWAELGDRGYIDREHLFWEDGLFLSIELDGEMESTEFTFNAEKWRSGLGAIYYGDCRAEKGADGAWAYTLGGFAIA